MAKPSKSAKSVPEPPWRAAERPAPRVPLTRESIVDAAITVLDRDGVDQLSMRRVADELGTGPASLYAHVRNKEELLQLVLERFTADLDQPPEPDPAHWQEQLKVLARELRRRMRQQRDIARISLGRVPSGKAIALQLEWYFELLKPLGIPDRVIAYAGDLLSLYVGAIAYEDSLPLASPTGEDLAPEEIVALFKEYFRSLPAEQFPYLHKALDLIFSTDRDDRFEFGLDILIRGLASYVGEANFGHDHPRPPDRTDSR